MLQAGVLLSVAPSPCMAWVSLSLSGRLCVGGFKNFRREGILKKIIFLSGKAKALLQFLVCVSACANCKCAYAVCRHFSM